MKAIAKADQNSPQIKFSPEEETAVICASESEINLDEAPAGSRAPVYNPISLENEADYFLTPKVPAQKLQRQTSVKKKKSLKRQGTLSKIEELEEIHQDTEDDDDVFEQSSQSKLEPKSEPNSDSEAKSLKVSQSVSKLEQIISQQKSQESRSVRDQVILRTRSNRMADRNRDRITSLSHESDLGYTPLNEQTRAWILAGAKNDEDLLRKLLNESPKIFGTRDPATGYTALHWAAKFGNVSLIHLLIGRFSMKVDIKTRGGYTPLMLSAIYRRREVYDLLQNVKLCLEFCKDTGCDQETKVTFKLQLDHKTKVQSL